MTIQDNPAQNNPAPEHALFGFPVYPLFCAGDPNNVAMGTTPEMVCPSVADTIKMWKLLLDPGHMIFNPAGLNAQQHIWHLIHGFATNHYSAAATARGIHLASQMLQLESLSYNKETAVKLYAQGCLISADTTDLENSNVPCIGWFTVTAGSSDIGFKLNPEYTKDVDAIIPWTSLNSLNRAALIRIQPGALNFTLYEQNYGNQGLPQSESESESGLGSDPGPFKFTGIEHLFPVDRLDVPLVPRDQATTIGIAISGSTGQINNWHFKQQGDRLNKSDRSEHAPCMLHIGFNDISQCVEETKIIDCSFLKTDGRRPWFTEVAVLAATLANRVTWNPTVYNNCLFNGVTLIGHAPKASLIFNECGFTSTSVDIRNKLNTAPPTLGIALSDCFGTNRVPNSPQDSIYFKVDPGQAVDVFGTDRAPAENKANPVKDSRTATRYITLDFVVGANHISDTPYGAAPAKITLMDRPDKYNPVSVNILGPAEVFMSNIAVSAIKCCPHRENHFVGINVVEPPRGTIFTDWVFTGGGNPSKTSVALSYSQGSTDIGVESLPAVLFDVLHIPAIDVDTSEHAAQFDLRYAEKWGKAGAWERARTIGLLRANATEENIAQIERVIERLAPTGKRDSAKLVPTPSIGTKYRVKPYI